MQRDFLNKLKDFGLNSYEAKLWTALLSRGVSTAGELSDIANVPRSRSYDVLESLEKKGFIVMKLGKPIKYLAVPPQEVLERVKRKIQEDADKQTNLLDTLKDSTVLNELAKLHTQGIETVEPTDFTGAIKGRNNIYNHLYSMIKDAKHSVTIATTEEGFLRKAEALKPALQKAQKNGAIIRIAAPLTKKTQHLVKELSFAQIKHLDDVKARFCIVDGKQVAFFLSDDKEVHPSYDVGIWASTPFFAGALDTIFNKAWKGYKEK